MLQETSERLLVSITAARQQFQNFSETEWVAKATPGAWSRKEILGHLIDSAANNHLRFVRAQLATDRFEGIAYEQDFFVSSQKYNEVPASELIELWFAYNRLLAHVIYNINPVKMDVICHIGNCDPVPLSFIITDYVTHLTHHTAQIIKT